MALIRRNQESYDDAKLVLIVVGERFPSNSAPSARLSNLVAKLVAAGQLVTIVSPIDSARVASRARLSGRKSSSSRVLQILPRIRFSHAMAKALNIISSFLLPSIPLFKRFDLVIFSVPPIDATLGFHLGMSFSQVFRNPRSKFVYDYRDDILDSSTYGRGMRGIFAIDMLLLKPILVITAAVLRGSDAIVCTTEEHRRLLVQRGFDAQKVKVIHNGADTELFRFADEPERQMFRSKYRLPTNAFVLVVVTEADWIKYRLDNIIVAVKENQQISRNLVLAVVGRWTSSLAPYFNLARELEVDMRYMGELAHDKVFEVLNAADIGIIPCGDYSSVKYIIPVKLYEYCSCGLPVLVTAPADSLMERLVSEHSLGFVCRPYDKREIANSLKRFLLYKNLRETMGRHCRAVVQKTYDRRALSDKYKSLLEMIRAE
jgi:glycosyltransferase involved in cell wall biosynthesis